MRRHLVLAALCAAVSLCAQPIKERPKRPSTGLKVLSATIDEKTRTIVVEVQNTTEKTAVGHAVVYWESAGDGRLITPLEGAGIAIDYAGPVPNEKEFIRPGQVFTIHDGYAVSPEAVSAEAVVISVIYQDDSVEGSPTRMYFDLRQRQAKTARDQAAKETGDRKTELERRANWFESHSAQQGAEK